MNYLAHAYLSFQQPEILVGNMISDFVKGNKKFNYPPLILAGIHLHRAIDQFTDQHSATSRLKEVFKPSYRLYSGAFADVAYDHFLANDPSLFPDEQLFAFSQWVYQNLDAYVEIFPEKFRDMYPYMKQHNWLYNYRLRRGMEQSFGGLVRRAAYLTESDTAFRLFEEHYDTIAECYQSFFPAVKEFAFDQLQQIQSGNNMNKL